MKSSLFEKLQNAPGINWFNWSDKTVRPTPGARTEPSESQSHAALYRMANKYFEHLVVQDKYIQILNKLIDQYSYEVEKWDLIQLNHENEIKEIKKEVYKKLSGTEKHLLKTRIDQLESKLRKYEANNVSLLNKPNADSLCSHLKQIKKKIYKKGTLEQATASDLINTLLEIIERDKRERLHQ